VLDELLAAGGTWNAKGLGGGPDVVLGAPAGVVNENGLGVLKANGFGGEVAVLAEVVIKEVAGAVEVSEPNDVAEEPNELMLFGAPKLHPDVVVGFLGGSTAPFIDEVPNPNPPALGSDGNPEGEAAGPAGTGLTGNIPDLEDKLSVLLSVLDVLNPAKGFLDAAFAVRSTGNPKPILGESADPEPILEMLFTDPEDSSSLSLRFLLRPSLLTTIARGSSTPIKDLRTFIL